MSVTVPDPSGGPHRQSHATVVLIDPATGTPTAPLAGTLTVTVGQITTTTTTIDSGQSVSGDVDLGLMRLGRIVMPAAWTAANLTLQTSHDGVTFGDLYDKDGAEYTIAANASRETLIPLADMLSVRYLRIRSGAGAAVVPQAAGRTLTLVLVP